MGILQIFENFYESVPGRTPPEVGHIYWVPTPDISEVPLIMDAQRASPTEHEISSFEIQQISNHHFKSRDRLPIKKLNLGETEELIVAKAKKRPSVVLASICTDDVDSLPEGAQKRLAKPLGKKCYLVAPTFSTTTMMDPGTFGPVLVARIRALKYHHLFCLPDPSKTSVPSSIVRLDRIFPTFLGRGCEHFGLKLHEEPFSILQSQFNILSGGNNSEPYELVKELVKEALPPEYDL